MSLIIFCASFGGAIPGNLARSVAGQIMTDGRIQRSWLGIDVQPLFLDTHNGVWVLRVRDPNAPRQFKTPLVPIVPILSTLATVLGLFSLAWYRSLRPEDRAAADALVLDHARRLYGKAVHQLTAGQVKEVTALVKGHFDN